MDSSTLILLLIPVLLLELVMRVIALVQWSRSTSTRGNRVLWLLLILLVNFAWIAWFLVGERQDETAA